jgi:hypothetical protein
MHSPQFWRLYEYGYVFVEEGKMYDDEVGDIVLCVQCHEQINRRESPQYAAIIQPPDTMFFFHNQCIVKFGLNEMKRVLITERHDVPKNDEGAV